MLKQPTESEIKEILIKGWMTHDGMWFYHCLQECGIEKTNKINKAAVKSMSLIEIKRMMHLFGIESIETFEELKRFVIDMFQVVRADFMKFSFEFNQDNEMFGKMEECFAYNGAKRMGVENSYICGIYERIDGWLEGLGLTFEAFPEIGGCLMHKQGKCERTYKFTF